MCASFVFSLVVVTFQLVVVQTDASCLARVLLTWDGLESVYNQLGVTYRNKPVYEGLGLGYHYRYLSYYADDTIRGWVIGDNYTAISGRVLAGANRESSCPYEDDMWQTTVNGVWVEAPNLHVSGILPCNSGVVLRTRFSFTAGARTQASFAIGAESTSGIATVESCGRDTMILPIEPRGDPIDDYADTECRYNYYPERYNAVYTRTSFVIFDVGHYELVTGSNTSAWEFTLGVSCVPDTLEPTTATPTTGTPTTTPSRTTPQTAAPSFSPTLNPTRPSGSPTFLPTSYPSHMPTIEPTTTIPTTEPTTTIPTTEPTTTIPTTMPSRSPSARGVALNSSTDESALETSSMIVIVVVSGLVLIIIIVLLVRRQRSKKPSVTVASPDFFVKNSTFQPLGGNQLPAPTRTLNEPSMYAKLNSNNMYGGTIRATQEHSYASLQANSTVQPQYAIPSETDDVAAGSTFDAQAANPVFYAQARAVDNYRDSAIGDGPLYAFPEASPEASPEAFVYTQPTVSLKRTDSVEIPAKAEDFC